MRDANGIRVEAAAENNLRDVDVRIGPGVTAVVGTSGSGKSSLVFDTVYHEARRRLLQTISSSPSVRSLQPARVRAIHGLTPAVAVAQNVVNRNPHSTVASAAGIHPYLRVLYARFATRSCLRCGTVSDLAGLERQVARLHELAAAGAVTVLAPLLQDVQGSHRHLLAELQERFPRAIRVDGEPWPGRVGSAGRSLDPDHPHTVQVQVGTAGPGTPAADLRTLINTVADLGATRITFEADGRQRTLSRIPVCSACGENLPRVRPQDFRADGPVTAGHQIGGLTLPALLALDVRDALAALRAADMPEAAAEPLEQVLRRVDGLARLELTHLALDRTAPSLSRGEAQRLRLAVILANDLEDLLHVVDEPTIGLGRDQVAVLLRELGRLAGPVLLVEHDREAVAGADHVLELGPGPGPAGGRLVFDGTPAELWQADTASGRWFSGREASPLLARGDLSLTRITVRGARRHNLREVDVSLPVGALTVVTGPSGAGKSSLVRDVLLESITTGQPQGCDSVDGPALTVIAVDQSPIGINPRSNPATYTGLADRIRAAFASGTGVATGMFSFNRTEGACQICRGMGAVEVKLRFQASEWVGCEACGGRRFSDEVLAVRTELGDGNRYDIGQVLELTVSQAVPLFTADARARKILTALTDVGLGYLTLGRTSTTLSGGEAQRVRLAKHLATVRPGQLVCLDEPTTGLHPADVPQVAAVLRLLADRGCTVVVVEHNRDIVAMADWVIEMGPGGGPDGGQVLSCGPGAGPAPGEGNTQRVRSGPAPRARPRRWRRAHDEIRITGARANNLNDVSVTLPRGAMTAVVGVSGSGKSSLVHDVLGAEARHRLLESLSVYERQTVTDGPHGQVEAITGLGPTLSIGPESHRGDPRSTVATRSDLELHLGVVLAYLGVRDCPHCGGPQQRRDPRPGTSWRCADCGWDGPAGDPVDFLPSRYESACLECHGLGHVARPRVEQLIIHPELPLLAGAMYSPGFFPRSYLGKPANGGYWMLQAIAERYRFDPEVTPWNEMTHDAQQAFLFAREEVTMASEARVSPSRKVTWLGVFTILNSWDVGGLYTERVPCRQCGGSRLRPDAAAVRVGGLDRSQLFGQPLAAVRGVLADLVVSPDAPDWAGWSLAVAQRRLAFLSRVGLDYLHLDRSSATLSAGESQRVGLAGLLGSELTGMTLLLDEPSRGLHPAEVEELAGTLEELRAAGNTLVVVDHEPRLTARAGHLVVLGPGAGPHGGRVIAAGSATTVRRDPAASGLVAPAPPARVRGPRRQPTGSLTVRGATGHNLVGDDIAIPLGVLAGICGPSGSGKSTLAIDTLARALAPARVTSSVAVTPVDPQPHDGIDGAPERVEHVDQSTVGMNAPGAFLGVMTALRGGYADSAAAVAQGLSADDLKPGCDVCHGRGQIREDMGFMPAVHVPCDACAGTGCTAQVRDLVVRGHSLPDLARLSLDEVRAVWDDLGVVANRLGVAGRLGLGYLALGQAAGALSGGERQRLRLVKQLAKRSLRPGLYILDEPTIGLHGQDVVHLVSALDELVEGGHSVLVVEHDPAFLAACDQLVEFGPGAGPAGGRVVATGTPEELADGKTATARFLREVWS